MFLSQFVYSLQVQYVFLCFSIFACLYMYFLLSRFLYVNPIPFSTLQREAESTNWKVTLLSGLLEHWSDGGVFTSDIEGMHESTDGFPVKSIWIYSYLGCCVCLDRGQKLAIKGKMLLVDVMDGSL